MSIAIRRATPGRRRLPRRADDARGRRPVPVRPPRDHARGAARGDRRAREREPEDFGRFVVEVDGEPAGVMGFRVENKRSRIAQLGGLAIHPSFRGRHLADEAARLLQRHLLADLGFHRLQLEIYAFNERAIRHAERSGFVREGVRRKAYWRHGEWVDGVLYGLLAEDLNASTITSRSREAPAASRGRPCCSRRRPTGRSSAAVRSAGRSERAVRTARGRSRAATGWSVAREDPALDRPAGDDPRGARRAGRAACTRPSAPSSRIPAQTPSPVAIGDPSAAKQLSTAAAGLFPATPRSGWAAMFSIHSSITSSAIGVWSNSRAGRTGRR